MVCPYEEPTDCGVYRNNGVRHQLLGPRGLRHIRCPRTTPGGQGFVEMLQLTQAQDGQLLGSLASTALKPDGSITQGITNISGVADSSTPPFP